jgi:hypothetical protein
VKLYEVETGSNRHRAGAAEVSGQPDSPAIDEDLRILRRHINLQGATGWRVWPRRIGISGTMRSIRLFALNRITRQRAGNGPYRCADRGALSRLAGNPANDRTRCGTDCGTPQSPALSRCRGCRTSGKYQQEDHAWRDVLFHHSSPPVQL